MAPWSPVRPVRVTHFSAPGPGARPAPRPAPGPAPDLRGRPQVKKVKRSGTLGTPLGVLRVGGSFVPYEARSAAPHDPYARKRGKDSQQWL
ncbi:hypothetical protein FGF04_01545 [Streptomyces apricus]|uniref:Uncharacterized protein n=1 Tax=Streptomyces apricus TaxID=1828112 RepID=A0A5B0BMM1_9ACTN|nr:hypothetical protein FGF04_01545 [Streptomyces apricus]